MIAMPKMTDFLVDKSKIIEPAELQEDESPHVPADIRLRAIERYIEEHPEEAEWTCPEIIQDRFRKGRDTWDEERIWGRNLGSMEIKEPFRPTEHGDFKICSKY